VLDAETERVRVVSNLELELQLANGIVSSGIKIQGEWGVGFAPCSGGSNTNPLLTPWLYSASELYRLSDCRLSAKLVPTFADRGMSHGQCGGSLTAVISVF
jgi:hypothetical protein